MGGCRCSYKTCKVRSDGKTHMFHFPVFDKLRCHQWITNAMKPNFLNLRLSQIKNRVVCQHHFNDNWFMNFMKTKLKPGAVPTEDGPYCSAIERIEPVQDDEKPTIAINVDDIEDEVLYHIDKRAHTSVKYGDFLISDTTELYNTRHNIDSPQKGQRNEPFVKSLLKEENNYTINYSNQLSDPVLYLAAPNQNMTQPIQTSTPKIVNQKAAAKKLSNTNLYDETSTQNPTMVTMEQKKDSLDHTILNLNEDVSATSNNTNLLYSDDVRNLTVVSIEYDNTFSRPISNNAPTTPQLQETYHTDHLPMKVQPIRNLDKVVTILSEKTISEPLTFEGKLEPISPSTIIRLPIRRSQRGKLNNFVVKPELKTEESLVNEHTTSIALQKNAIDQIVPIEYIPNENVLYKPMNEQEIIQFPTENKEIESENLITLNELLFENEQNKMLPTEHNVIQKTSPIKEFYSKSKASANQYNSRSIIKKMAPERLAAIEKKRNYNKKLRDVITSCVGNSNSTEPLDKESFRKINDKLSAMPSNESQGGNSKPDSTVAYLEARLQRMEDILLNKIDHNTSRINELKRTVKPSTGKKNANTQTYETEQTFKQYLYKEISKYLSPNANTTIYGELFLNTRDDVETAKPLAKKRRRR